MRCLLLLLVVLPVAQAAAQSRFEVSAAGTASRMVSSAPTDVRQLGGDLRLVWWPTEGIGLMVRGLGNWTAPSAPVAADVWRTRGEPPGPPDLRWAVLAGTDISLGAGSMTVAGRELRFRLLVPASLGAGRSDILLAPPTQAADGSIQPAIIGDAGWRLVGGAGLALRVELSRHFIMRLEVADLISSSHITTLNGCAAGDLQALDAALRTGVPIDAVPRDSVSGGCDVSAYSGVDSGQQPRAYAVPLALEAERVPSSSLLHLLSVQLGVGVTF